MDHPAKFFALAIGIVAVSPGCGDPASSDPVGVGGLGAGGGLQGGASTTGASGGTGGSAVGGSSTGGATGTAPLRRTSRIGVGSSRACAITSTRGVQCWGGSVAGGTEFDGTDWDQTWSSNAVICAARLDGTSQCNGLVPSVELPGEYSALATDGRQYACGIAALGGLLTCYGDLAEMPAGLPSAVPFKSIGCSSSFACGIELSGSIRCWGAGSGLGLGETSPPAGVFEMVETGTTAACALSPTGLACWGQEPCIRGLPSGPLVDFGFEKCGGCALDPAGNVKCWGQDKQTPLAGPFVDIATGDRMGCGIRPNGAVECWGAIQSVPAGLVALVD